MEVTKRGGTCMRLGLFNCDLGTQKGLEHAQWLVEKNRPRHLCCSPPCSAFSSLQNSEMKDPRRAEALRKRRLRSTR
eukprot:3036236-Amphidinium_carterae.1